MCGGGARLPSAAAKAAGWGLSGLEFGINIPGTVGGAVKMNANAYGGELARGPRVGRRLHRRRARAPRARRARLRLPALEPRARARSSRGPRSRSRPATRRRSRPTLAEMRGSAPRGAALGDQDLRLDLQEPRRPPRRGPDRGPAARGGGLPRPARGGARFSDEARELRRERRRGDDRRRARADGGGPPPGPRALRRRARARGPGPGRGRVAATWELEADGARPRRLVPDACAGRRNRRGRARALWRAAGAAASLRALLAAPTCSGCATPRWSRCDEVKVEGVTRRTREEIDGGARRSAAREMTTLHVDDDELARPSRGYPTSTSLSADAELPQHG